MVVRLEDIELLKKQHAEWDKLSQKETERPFPNDQLVQTYKKHKLKIKEKIQKMEKEFFKET